ncbi:DUF2161 family putative PD-(D/E)XK-type phosphodiesterase [Paenibacillus validus]|uniref:Uncharacterized protein n=1 Tax=Paenibacillus validus TaxID=44253 RepID=A0A7X3CRJ6_9BACL|nr:MULTISPECIES: DUF2161 family putative PD-(D/E)XK-type phosphodiesterase [Paenibacillus]MED4600743.1 DUF2161 family putative PD-(D/E)XK-type phosphodiesterase [Paenibacillus validus]MED4606186.1 DUF2161 family putative PD-(D/E)XK-type phosphodiesterase [Paenibacillus validus]MUG70795.1 hypothetical protein [Paenibacillus validus]
MAIKSETELYAPVKTYLEQLGYEVRGEVRHCDLVAIRGDEPPLIVELKRSFSIPLLLQAIDRLRMSRTVYVAFEKPDKGRAPHRASWPELRTLCGMLGLGMMTVQFYKTKKPRVEVECHPPEAAEGRLSAGNGRRPRTSKYAAGKLEQEFRERQGDYNVGGSSKRKLVTAYREKSLHLAALLRQYGPMSPRKLRDMTGNSRSAAMLQKNVYLWFQRVERGVYQLTPQGEEALLTYAHVVQAFRLEPVPLTGETNEAAAEPIGSLSGSV